MKEVQHLGREALRLRAALSSHRPTDQSQVDRWRTALAISLFAGDLDGSARILREAAAELSGVTAFDELLAPAMHDIGLLWECNEITIADEHVATAITLRLIDAVAPSLLPPASATHRTALLAVPPSERHTVGLRMAEVVLRSLGYACRFVGGDLPVDELHRAVARHAPSVVAVSTTVASPSELQAAAQAIADACPSTQLLLGGAGASLAPESLAGQVMSGMQDLVQRLTPPATTPPAEAVQERDPVGRRRPGHSVDLLSQPPIMDAAIPRTDWATQLMSGESDVDRSRRALLALAEEVSASGSWAWDLVSGDMSWSENLFRILGVDPDEDRPGVATLLERTHPDDRRRVAAILHQAQAGEAISDATYRVLTERNTTRFLHVVVALRLVRPEGPLLVGWVRDVTESREAEGQIAAHIAVTESLNMWGSSANDAERLLASLAGALGFTRAALWVPSGEALVARTLWERDDPAALAAELSSLRLRRGQGLAGRAWQERHPVTVRDIGSDPGNQFRTLALERGLHGAIALPILHDDEVLAVISLSGPDVLDLTDRLRATLAGLSHELGAFFAGRVAELRGCVLSAREVEVLQLAAEGVSGPDIARRLHLSPATVKTHFENIYAKYGVPDRVSAVAKALREGLIR